MKKTVMMIASLSILSTNIYAIETNTMGSDMSTKAVDKSQMSGDSFLEANKKKSGVVTLADGLQYKILVEGKGPKPASNDTVTVHYAGRLVDGTEFDSSYKRGEPTSFPVSGVIAGWTEALKLMPVGSTWELYIPASLAYGDQGVPPVIGPKQTLIFKVNLIEIKK